jgi:uncharacterized repeat protein (TIGR01451 family)
MSRSKHAIAVLAFAAVVAAGCQTVRTTTRPHGDPTIARTKTTADNAMTQVADDAAPSQASTLETLSAPATPSVAPGKTRSGTLFYPTGSAETSTLKLVKTAPAEVVANKPFAYTLDITNISKTTLSNVEVVESLPPGLKLGDVSGGKVAETQGQARLILGDLKPGETRSVTVNATASAAGQQSSCASVSYNTSLCMDVNVVAPSIAGEALDGVDTLLCNAVTLKFSVTNNGTGTARAVKFNSTLPEGVKTTDNKSNVVADVGDLPAGVSRTVEVPVKLERRGTFAVAGKFTADDGLATEKSTNVTARQPELVVTKTGPTNAYVGEQFAYEIVVTNKGDADATNLVVVDSLPAGTQATDPGKNASVTNGKVTWNLGTLAKGASTTLKLNASSANIGPARNSVTATADCAKPATVSAETQIVGIPALLLEVVDSPDPVRLNGETTYTITVTNQGSAVATNVKVVCTLEGEMTFVSAGGATNASAEGTTVTFQPLATLAAKAKATYTVTVKATGVGDVRFKTSMTADQLKRPVEETEATNFYK